MKRLIVIVLVIILFVLMLSRCTPNQNESLSIETPTSSPSPSVVDLTQPSDPEESSPMSTDTPSPSASPTVKPSASPTAKPSVKPSAIATKTASPTPKKSVKPTSSPSEEVIEPDTTVINDADGDGWPDYIKPTVTFTNITCEELEDKFLYKYDINYLGGDNYELPAKVRGGFRMELRDGKFWFSISEADLRNPRYVGPIIYKINSVEDRSWTYFERWNFSKKNWSYGNRGIQSPLTINALYTGIDESFPKPVIEISLCKK